MTERTTLSIISNTKITMVADIKWDPRESFVMNSSFLDVAIFFSLPEKKSWNVCNTVIYKNNKYKLYLRLLSEETEPRIYTESGRSEFVNDVWEEVKSAIINDTKSDFVRI